MADQQEPADAEQSDEPGPEPAPQRPPKDPDGDQIKAKAAKSPDEPGQKKERENKGAGEREPMGDRVYQGFYGNVYAPHATFGTSAGAADSEESRGRDEGPVDEAVITAIVRAYARPAGYDEARQALNDEHVLVLIGEAGSGRRAGAIAMLDSIRMSGKALVRINPSITIEKLAARSFDEGKGYLVSEKFAEQIVPELAEFHWDALCQKVRKAKAHLVVTADAGFTIATPDAVRHVSWQRPDAADALRAHLGGAQVADDAVRKVADALGTSYPLARVGGIARRILAGEGIGQILDEMQGGDQQAVADWLADVEAAIPAVLEVAALAFVLGVTERVFEDELVSLKGRLAEFAPELKTRSKKAKAVIDLRFQRLRQQRMGHKLLTVRQVPVASASGAIAVRHVDFRIPAYRQHIIAELWSNLGRDFWSGLRRWLHDVAAADQLDPGQSSRLMNSMAIGLALLALVAPDEVLDCYLRPWTEEAAGVSEQTMAVYVVWQMSTLEQTALLALRIAIMWAGQGSSTQRRLAAYVFSGELGARYPVEATKRLSQLADQKQPLVTLAFARLFATLAAQEADAVVVLRELRRRRADKTDRQSTDLLMQTIAELVSARDYRSGRPAVVVFLQDNPERAADLGALWGQALYLRPWRERAIKALVIFVEAIAKPASGVKAKPQPPTERDVLVRALGSAIGNELPPFERAPLRYEITRWVDEKYRRDQRDRKARNNESDPPLSAEADELLEKLLNAIANPSPLELGE
jgi:hypothetical protein